MPQNDLHRAILFLRPTQEILCLIKSNPALVTEKDDRGLLPLHSAAFWNAGVEVTQALQKEYPEGAKVVAYDGETPADKARKQGHAALAQLLDGYTPAAAAPSRPPAPAPAPAASLHVGTPHWAHAFSAESTFDDTKKDVKVAVGVIADAAVRAVKAYLGDFTGLLGIVDTLRTQVMHLSWSSNQSSERQAVVKYDEYSGQYAVLIIERQSSSKDLKVPMVGSKTYTAKLKIKFKRAQAKNDAARAICQRLMDNAAGDLVKTLEQMKIF